jgi:hypothetical protein
MIASHKSTKKYKCQEAFISKVKTELNDIRFSRLGQIFLDFP